LDEPFSALDPLLKERLELELLDLQKVFGGSILFVTHDLNEGYKLGSMVAVYHSGSIIQHDTKENVFSHPANRNVAKMTGMRNLIEGVITAIEGENITVDIPSWQTCLRVLNSRAGSYHINQDILLGIRPEYITVDVAPGENMVAARTVHKMEGIASINYRFHVNSDSSGKRYLEAVISKSCAHPLPEDKDCYLYLNPELLVLMAE